MVEKETLVATLDGSSAAICGVVAGAGGIEVAEHRVCGIKNSSSGFREGVRGCGRFVMWSGAGFEYPEVVALNELLAEIACEGGASEVEPLLCLEEKLPDLERVVGSVRIVEKDRVD